MTETKSRVCCKCYVMNHTIIKPIAMMSCIYNNIYIYMHILLYIFICILTAEGCPVSLTVDFQLCVGNGMMHVAAQKGRPWCLRVIMVMVANARSICTNI